MNYQRLYTLIRRLGVHPVLGDPGEGWNIEQNAHELATFLSELPAGIHSALEIGTGYRAGLSRFLTEFLEWKVVTVDCYTPQLLPELAHFVLGNSHQAATRRLITDSYDLVLIDGDHSYEGVKQDYETYAPMAGVAVMLHDIAGLRDCEGVAHFWQEISRTKAGKLRKGFGEVIDESPYRAGIGWVLR